MHSVGLIVHPDAMLYETAIAAEVFGAERSDLAPSDTLYDLVVFTADGAPSPWLPGVASRDLGQLTEMDTVVVPSTKNFEGPPDPALTMALQSAHDAGTRIVGLCTGAFILAAAGLLNERPATTHWLHAAELAQRYPEVEVRADVLYVDDGSVLTSAGKTAALDLCLHIIHRDHGAAASNGLARRLVVPTHRRGGQAQFVTPPPDPHVSDRLGTALEWARGHLDRSITVRDLAREARLSTRHLARRMRAELGSTPLDWLHQQRVMRAQDLLERTDASVEQIAEKCGMGTATTLRRHFSRSVGVSPTVYRASFRA